MLVAAGACQTQTQTRTTSRPTPQDASSPGEQAKVVDQLLRRCHNMLRGSMDNAYLELRKEGAEVPDKVLLGRGGTSGSGGSSSGDRGKPVYLRLTHPDSSTSILNDKHAGRYRRAAEGRYTQAKLTAAQQKQLRDLNALLRAALLRPLYEAQRVHRQGPRVYQLILEGGETWRLEVDPENQLPKSLTGPPGKVSFVEHKATGVTFLPQVVTLGSLGTYHVNLIDSGLAFNKPYFEDPETPLTAFKELREVAVVGSEPRTPVLQTLPGRVSLLLEDPGDWEERIASSNTHGRELYAQGQIGTDLMFFYQEAGKRYMAIPFEPDEERRSQPFLRKKHQKVVRRPPQQLVAVVCVDGSEKGAAATGMKILQQFLAKQKLRASGPLRVIPYVLPENGVPDARKLEHLTVRLELPVGK